MPEQSDITSTDSSCFKFTYCTSDSGKYRKHCKHTSYVLMSECIEELEKSREETGN